MPGCNPLLKDPLNRLWALGVIDTGALTLTLIGTPVAVQSNPILIDNQGQQTKWQLSASVNGNIVATKVPTLPTLRQALTYIPLVSADGLNFKMVLLPTGQLQTQVTSQLLPDVIPYIPNVAMSIYGNYNPYVVCPACNNAIVTVSADLSCWCCTCSCFVLPEDTTIIVVLDE